MPNEEKLSKAMGTVIGLGCLASLLLFVATLFLVLLVVFDQLVGQL